MVSPFVASPLLNANDPLTPILPASARGIVTNSDLLKLPIPDAILETSFKPVTFYAFNQ